MFQRSAPVTHERQALSRQQEQSGLIFVESVREAFLTEGSEATVYLQVER